MRSLYDCITSASKHNKNGQYGDRKITVCNMSVLGNHSVGNEIEQVHCYRQSTASTFKQICVSHIASVSQSRNDEREASKRENQNNSADLEITEVGLHGLVLWQNVSLDALRKPRLARVPKSHQRLGSGFRSSLWIRGRAG